MRVTIDPTLCEGNAVCEALAPTVFAVEDDAQAHLLEPTISAEQRELVQRAVDGCPRFAITIVE